ncbi:MAG: chorismate synthase [Pseudoflavonifractor sp.]
MKYVIFGESHGPAIGVVLEGLPSGLPLDMDFIRSEMARRAPGGSPLATARQEADQVQILSGVYEGKTIGTPLCGVIANSDRHSADYANLAQLPRPGHADYAGSVRYGGCNDPRGGGHFSGRLTAPLVFAGALAKLILKERQIFVSAELSNVAGISDPSPAQYEAAVLAAKAEGDSVGGCIRCRVSGLPAGLGSPDYGQNLEGIFAQALYAVPAVKAVSFGAGFGFAALRGSAANDPFYMEEGAVKTRTNHSGGVNGGITNGMPVEFEVCLRPTPSIAKEQDTVNLSRRTDEKLSVTGRHDPCILARALPVIEAAAALAACQVLGV